MATTRRQCLSTTAAALAAPLLSSRAWGRQRAAADAHIAVNMYPWLTFARRDGRAFEPHSDELLQRIAATGVDGYEPIVNDVAELAGLDERLQRRSLEMRSLYVNSVLHDKREAEQSVADVIAIARRAAPMGTRIVVANPSPIRWGGSEDKTDPELRFQATMLDLLGGELRKLGLTLAYHNHDAELRQGGREFHHMLTATKPENVRFCLDAHWIFRGCGDSEVALFDALAHYHGRIAELHLRQSIGGVWTEDFRLAGDVDYQRLFDFLAERDVAPHL